MSNIEILKIADIIMSIICSPYLNYDIKWLNSNIIKLKLDHDIEQAIKERKFANFVPIKPSTACNLIIIADKESSIYQNGWYQLDWI